jgi:predicted AAA+ superfamily ATPase
LEGSRIFEEFKGALTEQYVCQELTTFDTLQSSYYWSSNAKAEVDFVFSDGLNVYPLEVKSGYSVNAKSLKSYIDRYHPLQALRTSLLPYKVDDRIINIPLYMLFALEKIMASQNH